MIVDSSYASGMGYIPLIAVDRAKLTTNVPASTLSPWSDGISYALHAEVIDEATRTVYRSLAAANVGNPTSDATKWQDRGPENRYALLDGSFGTSTTNPELIEFSYPPGQVVTDVSLWGVSAHAVQVMLVQGEGQAQQVLFDSGDVSMLKPCGNSHWGYFFEPLERERRVLISGLPAVTQATLIVRIKAPGGIAKCSEVAFGRAVWLGDTYWRPSIGFDEWGEKARDKWGGWTVTPDAPYSDRMELQVLMRGTAYERTRQRVVAVRRKPVVWIGAHGVSALMTLGYITSFKQVLVAHGFSDCSMVIEGLEMTDE